MQTCGRRERSTGFYTSLMLLYLLNQVQQTKPVQTGGGAFGEGVRFPAPPLLTLPCFCCRRQSHVLVAGPRRGEAELLGRLPARRAAVLLQPGGELRGHELLLQLRRRQRHVVPLKNPSTFPQFGSSSSARGQIQEVFWFFFKLFFFSLSLSGPDELIIWLS